MGSQGLILLDLEAKRHACRFCSKCFLRSDAARRHSKTCQSRGDKLLPSELKRGRKTQSCTSCACAKSRCDGDSPCRRCANKGLRCSYHRGNDDVRNSALNDAILADTTNANSAQEMSTPEVADVPKFNTIPVPFLLNFTDPHKHTIPEYFESTSLTKSTPEMQDTAGIADFEVEFDTWITTISQVFPIWDINDGNVLHDSVQPFMRSSGWGIAYDDTLQSQSLPAHSVLDQRADELASHLEPLGLSSATKEAIFGSGKLSIFVQAYFDYWHRHCPILHRPSFHPESTHLSLLLAVSLMGAMYRSEFSADLARECVHIAEEYIFEHQDFKSLLGPRNTSWPVEQSKDCLQVLQAAFTVGVMNNWGIDAKSRRRLRLQRYPQIVSAMRCLELPATSHEEYSLPLSQSTWVKWIQTEERIRLIKPALSVLPSSKWNRLATYIFLVDSSHVVFHQIPPRMIVAEMVGCLSCQEELFDASGVTKFNDLYSSSNSSPLSNHVSVLFEPSADVRQFGSLTVLNLFELIHGRDYSHLWAN